MKILLVEDNPSIVKGLIFSLEDAGYRTDYADSLSKAREKILLFNPDLCILDITLPDGNGIELYKKFLLPREIATIFLTAKDDEETIVECLKSGAEDYITKPFKSRELLVRIDKIFKRQNKSARTTVGDTTFDFDKMEVYRSDTKIELTSLELKIVQLLFANLNKVVRRDVIIEKIWEWTGNDVEDNTVTVYLKRIREKLGPDLIQTIKGIGYRIDEK